jgi:hypothetical protein
VKLLWNGHGFLVRKKPQKKKNSARVVFSQLYKTPWHIEQNLLKNAASNATESDTGQSWD